MREWISVEDRLPEPYQEVMYFAVIQLEMEHQYHYNREIMIGHREGKHWFHCCMFFSTQALASNVKVTHWMELPDYPKSN